MSLSGIFTIALGIRIADNTLMATRVTPRPKPLRRTVFVFLFGTALWMLSQSARAQLYVGSGNLAVGEYDAVTGATLNANFATATFGYPNSLLLSGNSLYVASYSYLDVFDATTGAPTSHFFIFAGIDGMAIMGNTLFVSTGNAIALYDATTGAVINANFITGLSTPKGLAISGNHLFVANDLDDGNGTIGEYDATTGATINASLVSGLTYPHSLAVSDDSLYVANGDNSIGKYDATTGATISSNFVLGLKGPISIAVSSNTLFVSNHDDYSIGSYDATTGAAFNPNLVTATSWPTAIAVGQVPEPGITMLSLLGGIGLLTRRRRN